MRRGSGDAAEKTRRGRRGLQLVLGGILAAGAIWTIFHDPAPKRTPVGSSADLMAKTDSSLLPGPALIPLGAEGAGKRGGVSSPSPTGAQPAASGTVRGVVLEEGTDTPVPGARVIAVAAARGVAALDTAVLTDDEGVFEIPVDPSRPLLVAFAPQYLVWRGPVAEAETPMTIRLRRGGKIEGVVQDDRGEPVGGARVWCSIRRVRYAWPHTESSLELAGDHSPGSATSSDANGRFELAGLSEDATYIVHVGKKGMVPGRLAICAIDGGDAEEVATSPGGRPVTLRLWSICELVIEITDAETGLPISSATPRFGSSGNVTTLEYDWYASLIRGATTDTWEQGSTQTRRYVRMKSTDMEDRTTISVSITHPGYKPFSKSYDLMFGSAVRDKAALKPIDASRLASVEFHAALQDGTPFKGRLQFTLFPERPRGRQLSPLVDFDKSGAGSHPVPLPLGVYKVLVAGSGLTGFWWNPAGEPVTLELTDAGPTRVDLKLTGVKTYVEVSDADRNAVHGYDFEVRRKGYLHGMIGIWDLPFMGRNPGEPPYVMLPPGENLLRVRYDGVGFWQGNVTIPSDSASVTVPIVVR